MAWDKILTGADQALNSQDSNVHLFTNSHGGANISIVVLYPETPFGAISIFYFQNKNRFFQKIFCVFPNF